MIALESLAALALGELEGDELDRVELHVLSCSACALTLERLIEVGPAVRELVTAGQVRTFAEPALLARLDELGLISRRYRVAPDQVVACSVGPNDVYALTELEAELAGVQCVDLLVSSEVGGEWRDRDVPFDPARGVVSVLDRGDALRLLPSTRIFLTLVAVEDGAERRLGEYVLAHEAGRQ